MGEKSKSPCRMKWVKAGSEPMDNVSRSFLEILRYALAGKKYPSVTELTPEDWRGIIRLSRRHHVLPMVAEAVWQEELKDNSVLRSLRDQAIKETDRQAHRSAEFLSLYQYLGQKGLAPVITKGIISRSLYPYPEQRASADEDFFILPEEFPIYLRALLDFGLTPIDSNINQEQAYESAFEDKDRGLIIEVHEYLFNPASKTFGELNDLFTDALKHSETYRIYGCDLVTLSPTDHLLYMLLHAYKHLLYGGFGIRQVCDIGMLAAHFSDDIVWTKIRENCEKARVGLFAAAVFRITERYLGFAQPEVFSGYSVDETDLLKDILTGGLYGVEDINRAHSATITLDAVGAQRQGKKSAGVLASVFLPLKSMAVKYPYLKKYPWLLPAAWVQRVGGYLLRHGKKVRPSESVRIGTERVALLKKYGIIE